MEVDKNEIEIEWVRDEVVGDQRVKHAPILRAIKKSGGRGWAKVAEFKNEPTARDLAHRLSKAHPDFQIVSRKSKDGDGTGSVYARYTGVTE